MVLQVPRENKYKVVTLNKSLYEKVISLTGAKSFSEAIQQLIPKCIQGYIIGSHIFIKVRISSVTIEGVAHVDISGISVRLDQVYNFLKEIAKNTPVIGLLGGLWVLSRIQEGEFKIVPKPERIELNREGYFLVDTGATMTVINTSLLPSEHKDIVLLSSRKESVQTASNIINVARGTAVLEIGDVKIEEPVHFIENPYLGHHLLGINTLRRVFGEKLLLDFANAKICRY